jgi:two-component SAPR family response regulator
MAQARQKRARATQRSLGRVGVQLASQAKAMRPGIRVLFATGYVQRATERGAMRLGRLLYKPLRQAEVIREVEAVLGVAA